MSSSSPLVINNENLVQMKQVDNTLQGAYNLTDSQFESYLCRQLANDVSPVDLSVNESDYSFPNSVSIMDSSLNFNYSTIINNNDNLISSENFAMKLNYVNQPVGTRDSYSYNIGDNIPTTISLSNSTSSLYNSNLKIDVSLNEDTQYTDVVYDGNRWSSGNQWAVDYDRSQPYMNYFSAINSASQDISGISPFFVRESAANSYALGHDPSGVNGVYTHKYFTRNTSGINHNIGTLVPQDICSNTLNQNYCGSYVQNYSTGTNGSTAPYAYDFSEFNSFKIVQDQPSVTDTLLDLSNDVLVAGSALPIQFNGQDISAGTFNTANIFNSGNQKFNTIGDGFQMSVIIGDVQQGGYTMASNDVFTLDDSYLTRNYNSPYLKIDVQESNHHVEITNGTLTASSIYETGNDSHIQIGTEAELLQSPFNTENGLVDIYVKTVNNRVYYVDASAGGGVNSVYDASFGTATSLTNHVNVVYTQAEATNAGVSTYLNQNSDLQTTEQVVFDAKVLAPSTANAGSFPIQGRTLATNNSAVMTIASNTLLDPSNIDVQNFTLVSSIPTVSDSIYIISVENKSVLTSPNTQLVDASSSTVTGTSAAVTMQNVDLSGINYEDYEVKLVTKTITDISNALLLNNGWSVVTTDPAHPSMIGTPLKTSVIHDDYLFMTNGNQLDISMQYQFLVDTPLVTSTQAIKHKVTFSFLDLLDNTSYNTSTTVASIDDSELNFTILSTPAPTVLTGCTNIAPSALNTGNYLLSNYTFTEYTQTKTYRATFDAKFPFYTNLLFKTPVITETSVYYKMYDLSGNEQPGYLLKYFKCSDDNQLLSEVSVSLDHAYTTNFLLTPSVCSIFKAELLGQVPGGSFVTIPNTPIVDLDPFFVLTSTISGIDYGSGLANITVKVSNNININSTYYTIPLQNAPGANVAFNAKKYVYSVNSPNNELDNFSLYADYYNNLNLTNNIPVKAVVSQSGANLVLTIYDTDNVTVLATVTHPSNFINNYNIIVCLWPFLQVDTYYDGSFKDSIKTLAINNRVNPREGVYYYINQNPAIGAHEKFGLVTDSFDLYFVHDISYVNQYSSRRLFTESNIDTWLYCNASQGSANYAKSVKFDILRGYTYTNSGQDIITLNRNSTTLTFYIDIVGGGPNVNGTQAVQEFYNVYNGQTLTVNAAVGQGPNTQTYNLGLKLNVNESMLANSETTSYTVYASVANFLSNIDSNPYTPSTIGILKSGFITDNQQQELFADPTNGVYIAGVKAACIKSYGVYYLAIKRNVPDLHVSSLATPSFVGDPRTQSGWSSLGDVSYNDFLLVGYVASNLNVYRQTTNVVFYNNYTSYYVVAPPSFDVYGYKSSLNISSVPLRSTSVLFSSFDVNLGTNSYVIDANTTAVTSNITLSQPTTVCYASYLNTSQTKYPFNLKGNYITVSLYNGGIGVNGSATSPYNTDQNSNNFYEVIISSRIYNNITDISSSYFTITLDNSLNYQVAYKQYLPGVGYTHNISANIIFSLGNAFTGPPPSNGDGFPSMFLRLKSSQGTQVAFYQSTPVYNPNTAAYYLQVDKFTTDSTMDYNAILNGSVRELFFPVASHYTKLVYLSNTVLDASSSILNQSDFIANANIDESTFDNLSWIQDNSFNLQYIGITISALSPWGIDALGDLFKYNATSYLQSKALYVRRQDIIRVLNGIGNSVFRVTNSGNVQSNRVTTSAVSLYVPINTIPNGTIGGSADIITLFGETTLINTVPL